MVGKVYTGVLKVDEKLITAEKVMGEQGGFRTGRGCNDQILIASEADYGDDH